MSHKICEKAGHQVALALTKWLCEYQASIADGEERYAARNKLDEIAVDDLLLKAHMIKTLCTYKPDEPFHITLVFTPKPYPDRLETVNEIKRLTATL